MGRPGWRLGGDVVYKGYRVTGHNLHQKALFDAPTDAEGMAHAPINNWPDNTVQEYER